MSNSLERRTFAFCLRVIALPESGEVRGKGGANPTLQYIIQALSNQ